MAERMERRDGWISASATFVAVLGGIATVAGLIIGFSAQYWITQVDNRLGSLNDSTSATTVAITALVTEFHGLVKQTEKDDAYRDVRLDKIELRLDRLDRTPIVGSVGPHPEHVQ